MTSVVVQRTNALAKANAIRTERAELKRMIARLPQAEGRYQVADLLLDPPDLVMSMPVGELLGAIRHFGDAKVHRLLMDLEVSVYRPVAHTRGRVPGMTVRQRLALSKRLKQGGVA